MAQPNEKDIIEQLAQAGKDWQDTYFHLLENELGNLSTDEELSLRTVFSLEEDERGLAEAIAKNEDTQAAYNKLVARMKGHGISEEELKALFILAGEIWRLEESVSVSEEETQEANELLLRQLESQDSSQPRQKESHTATGDTHSKTRSPDRAPKKSARIYRLNSWPRIAIAASFVIIASYGVLWTVGRSALPDTYELASVNEFEGVLAKS